MQWCDFWADFLEEKSLADGRLVYTHERLRKARRGIAALVRAGTMFAVNKDKNAPIFKQCDYGLVGDLKDVLPRLAAAL